MISSTRSRPNLPAAGLAFTEDDQGFDEATIFPLRVSRGARIYEVQGPDDWTALVERYPVDVTHSRRHDWQRAFGRPGPWIIPDYSRVARDYDGVHLTVWGYLTSAGLPLEVANGWTLLAGWSPDETYWISEAARVVHPGIRVAATDDSHTRWAAVDDEPTSSTS